MEGEESASVVVSAAGVGSVVGCFRSRPSREVPRAFAALCRQHGWPPADMWRKLTDMKRAWYEASNGAYIYYNTQDEHWWIDEPNGLGAYVAPGAIHPTPSSSGWRPLEGKPLPLPDVAFRAA
ncbi:MAG: hypothetical protein SGPRY_012649 [Prymnesium sp.]